MLDQIPNVYVHRVANVLEFQRCLQPIMMHRSGNGHFHNHHRVLVANAIAQSGAKAQKRIRMMRTPGVRMHTLRPINTGIGAPKLTIAMHIVDGHTDRCVRWYFQTATWQCDWLDVASCYDRDNGRYAHHFTNAHFGVLEAVDFFACQCPFFAVQHAIDFIEYASLMLWIDGQKEDCRGVCQSGCIRTL